MVTPGGLLLDIDGTLYVGDEAVPGAPEAVQALARRGIPVRYLTNTTRFSRRELAGRLRDLGFPAGDDELFTAPVAAAAWLAAEGIRRIALYVPDSTLEDFAAFQLVRDEPEAVVVGDLGEGWTFGRMNQAFRQLLGGARLVALQRNRYWRTPDGLTLDAGAIVAALEYGASAEALVVGKPSAEFFRLAAASLPGAGTLPLVVGDDVETDIAGARAAGLPAALVRTGKFREESLAAAEVRPDLVLDSAADLLELFER
ncbi:MAG TPA: TIGR01458 family HAD-type hydrolase [Longimicrobiales bacterium]